MAIQKFSEALHFHSALRTHWQGHHKRSQHFVDKMMNAAVATGGAMGQLNATYVIFINCLNSLELMKTNSTTRLRAAAMKAIKVIKETAVHSRWNFKNKVSNIQLFYDVLILPYYFKD
jgi:hypothetical protein